MTDTLTTVLDWWRAWPEYKKRGSIGLVWMVLMFAIILIMRSRL